MITVALVGGEKLIARLNSLNQKIVGELKATLTDLSFELVRHIVANKLSGQVLGKYTNWKATNRLRNSIHADPVTVEGNAIFTMVGTNVAYGKVHEYGFQGSVTVKEHLRMMKMAFGKPLKSPHQVSVKSHARRVNLPERSFLRSSLKDMEGRITAQIKAAVDRAVQS